MWSLRGCRNWRHVTRSVVARGNEIGRLQWGSSLATVLLKLAISEAAEASVTHVLAATSEFLLALALLHTSLPRRISRQPLHAEAHVECLLVGRNPRVSHLVFGHSNESLGSILYRRVLRWCGVCGCTPVRASVGPACCSNGIVARTNQGPS